MDEKLIFCIESRLMEDGKGGVFLDGVLIHICDSEAESDSLALSIVRHGVVAGLMERASQAYKDGKPIDLFDMTIK